MSSLIFPSQNLDPSLELCLFSPKELCSSTYLFPIISIFLSTGLFISTNKYALVSCVSKQEISFDLLMTTELTHYSSALQNLMSKAITYLNCLFTLQIISICLTLCHSNEITLLNNLHVVELKSLLSSSFSIFQFCSTFQAPF